jgi:hypothetical protein
LHAVGRPYNEDGYWLLRPLVKRAIEEEGDLSKFCRAAGCLAGRQSIDDWLEGREVTRGKDKGKRTPRALPDAYAIALMTFLSDDRRYSEEAKKVREQALEWFELRLPKCKLRAQVTSGLGWIHIIDEMEESEAKEYMPIVRAYWYVVHYLAP